MKVAEVQRKMPILIGEEMADGSILRGKRGDKEIFGNGGQILRYRRRDALKRREKEKRRELGN